MIKLERTSVMNFENALRGMRNPMNSWDKSDSYYSCEDCECQTRCAENCEYCDFSKIGRVYEIGPNDLDLAQRLAKSGSDHRKFLRQIFVSVDVTAPLYWWKEYDTYKVGTVANSTSTMHKIHSKAFSRDDFSCDRMSDIALTCLDQVIEVLEERRQKYIETKDTAYWHDMIQLLPTSYNQMRTCTLNYENLINIYYARRYHKLPEWHVYCDWIASLPYAKELITSLRDKAELSE
jgi:hypothetical protein